MVPEYDGGLGREFWIWGGFWLVIGKGGRYIYGRDVSICCSNS